MRERYLTCAIAFVLLCAPVVLAGEEKPAITEGRQEESERRLANVKEFGAVGDGVTDDAGAFQKAIDAVTKSGGTVFVPEGNYRLKTTLRLPGSHPSIDRPLDYIEIRGEGKNTTRLLGDGVDYIFKAAEIYDKSGSRIVNGISIVDLTLTSFKLSDRIGWCGGIDASYMIRWSVRGCHFIALKTGIFSFGREGMKGESHDEAAVYIIRINNNVFYACSDYAVKLGRIFDLVFENNEVEHGVGGVAIGTPGDGFDAAANTVRIENNIFEGLGDGAPAILGSCWVGARIVGNYFEANQGGDIELTPKSGDGWSRSIVIESNTLQPTKEQRTCGTYGPIKLNQALDILIAGNFTTSEVLLHPNSGPLGKGVNIVSNTLNNPPEITDIKGAKPGNATDYIGELSPGLLREAEQWTVNSPSASVGIHSVFGFRFQPKGENFRSVAYASAIPTGDKVLHEAGDIFLNSSPSVQGRNQILLGWVCIKSGRPGVWKPLFSSTEP